MSRPRVVILGAGPAGVAAAFHLSRRKIADVTVLEQNQQPGGNAGSFEIDGIRVDFGSHRLHPACDSEVLRDIRGLLGSDLLQRKRHGRIRLKGRWIHFPLHLFDLGARLPPSFIAGVIRDRIHKALGHRISGPPSFATVLEAGLGSTICKNFYFPYAEKLWGIAPEELAPIQAHRRISAGFLRKILWKILSAMPGLRTPGQGYFFYPRLGYGQISDAYFEAAKREGATVHFGARVETVKMPQNQVAAVCFRKGNSCQEIEATHVFSTIPINALARTAMPAAPPDVATAATAIRFRGMVLVYLVVGQDRFSEYDAHYFPGPEITISRLSEPKIFSDGAGTPGITVLCAEIPCDVNGKIWSLSDEDLGQTVLDSLRTAEIPVRAKVLRVLSRKLPNAYPIYDQDYEPYFETLDAWAGSIKGLLSFGRQGLFIHNNTHHALFMGYAASNCLDEAGTFDEPRWKQYRQIFESHVVED